VANNSSANVTILQDFNGNGFDSTQFVSVGRFPSSLAAADSDGDGRVDYLAVANESDGTLSILGNDGNGGFTADPNRITVGNKPFSVVTGYFNGDAYPDLAVANYGTHPTGGDLGHVSIVLANGPDSFHTAQRACDVGMGPANLVVDDFDGDGNADLAVANFLSDTVTVCRGAGDGTFTALPELSAGSGPIDIDVADLDVDGDRDLLVANVTSKDIAILRNQSTPGTFKFAPAESYGVARFAGGARLALDVGDFDRNGTPDLAVANQVDRNVSVHLNSLVAGAHRVASTGTGTVSGMDFAIQPYNAAPTVDSIVAPAPINEDPGEEQTVSVTGISAGEGEVQEVDVAATSDNTALIPAVTVDYTSPDSTATLRYTPAVDRHGTAAITVTVMDGGLDDNLATVQDNGSFSRSFTVAVNPINDQPTAITLDGTSVQENLPGAVIGNLIVDDPDVGDTHTFTVADPRFEVVGGQLMLKGGKFLDYERGPTVAVYVTAIDAGGLGRTQAFAITVLNVNEPPAAILAVNENAEGELVGQLDVIDPDFGDTHLLSVSDSRFEVVNGRLKLKAGESLDHESEETVTVDVTATDVGGLEFTQSLAINVNDVNERPVATNPIPGQKAEENQPFSYTLAAGTFVDVDDDDQLTFQAVLSDDTALPNWLSFDQVTRHFSGTPRLGDQGRISIRVVATDTGGLSDDTTFTITVSADPDPWQNPGPASDARFDVDGNTLVTPNDVLQLINHINANGSGELPPWADPSDVEHRYVDVNGDNHCTPVDVLELINHINASTGAGEGEGESFGSTAAVPFSLTPLTDSPFSSWEKVNMRAPEPHDALCHPAAFPSPPSASDSRSSTRNLRPSTLAPQPSSDILSPDLDDLLPSLADDVSQAFGTQTAHDRLFARAD